MRDVSADGPSRRDFLKSAGGGVVGAMLGGPAGGGLALPTDDELAPMAALPQEVTRPWLGPPYWSNRLQDWRLHQGRIECLTGAESHEVRSVGVLTRSIAAGRQPGHLSVKTGLIEGQQGFCGFPVGVGEGDESALDYRAAALAQRGSGTGGGFLCTFEMDGRARFREHTDENNPLAFAELPSEKRVAEGGALQPTPGRPVRLRLDVLPQSSARATAWCASTKTSRRTSSNAGPGTKTPTPADSSSRGGRTASPSTKRTGAMRRRNPCGFERRTVDDGRRLFRP